MTLATPMLPNAVPAVRERAARGRVTWGRTFFVLLFRVFAFAVVQALVAAAYALTGAARPWAASVAWWPLSATLAGVGSFLVLRRAARKEGLRYVDVLSARRDTWRGDLLWSIVLLLLSGPIAYLPMGALSRALFGDATAASALMFRPLPWLAAVVLFVAFPLSVALTELPSYFGYGMPRLEALSGRAWLAVLVAAFLLALQHVTLPLLFDGRFVLWRLGMFLPFALLLGVALRLRPTMMPYLMVGHFLIDLSSAYFFLAISGS